MDLCRSQQQQECLKIYLYAKKPEKKIYLIRPLIFVLSRDLNYIWPVVDSKQQGLYVTIA